MSIDKNFIKRVGKKVYIKQPSFDELDYIAELWSDEKTMNDVGGVIKFKEERRSDWYTKMVRPSDDKNFYCLIYTKENVPVGEVSFHRFDKVKRSGELNIKVQYKFRGNGYAKEALILLLGHYFNEFGGQVITDEVININGQEALKKFGFEVISKSDERINFEMTNEKYKYLYDSNGNKNCDREEFLL